MVAFDTDILTGILMGQPEIVGRVGQIPAS